MACYLVTPQDNEVAKYVEGWTGRTVARLRGMYETQKGKALDISDAAKAAKILSGLRRKLLTQHIDRSSTNMIEAFRSLRSAMSAGTRYNRIRMLTTMFASELDRIQLREPNLTRQQIANSIENSDGTVQYGQSYIFDAIFSRLLKAHKAYSDAGDEYKANEISKVLDNFGALCAYTKVALRDTEGFKLGSRIGFAASTTPEDFGDNDLSAWFDPEAHTRESWQESTDMTSAFSSLSEAVRRVISTLKATDEHGNVLKDDLGIPMYVNPITAHQSLVEELAGIPLREDDMVQRIKDSSLPFAKQLVQILANNNQVRTQFCCELCRCNQLYGDVAYEHLPNGTIKTKTRILNKLRNLLTGNYTTRVMMGKTLSPHSVYSEGGKINWANVQALRQYIKDNFIGETTEGGTIFDQTQAKNGRNTPFGNASVNERAGMLMHVMQALGIDLDTETAVKLAKSKDLFYNTNTGMVRNIRGLILGADGTTPTGIDALLTSSDIKALEAGDYSKLSRKEKTFRQLLRAKTSTQAKLSKQGNVQEVVNRLLDNIATKREAYRVESRCTVRDKKGKTKTLYSHVAPSYMGTFIERINAYAGANNHEAIKQFIREKFLDSSMFVDDNGRILNRWMSDLYNESLNGKSLAELMTYHRFIGEANLEFEDFTSKQHAISMMHEYFFADNLTDSEGRKYANYPVFILGDSGVCKFIRAKRYEAQEILDGMYDIYLAEMRRNKLIEAANNQLISEGKKPIDNTTTKDGKTDTSFKMLPFLEDENYRPKGDPATWTKEQVQTAIRKYMRQAVKDFKANIARLGLLDKTSTGEYRYFSDVMGEFYGKDSNGQRLNTPEAMEEAFNKMLANYFWNTKFATLQQFQLMTIDVAFYKSTKDLQKRYKEIHAPGRPASIQAKDFDGNYYCGVDKDGNLDPIETCVYFDDPKINAENSNPEFMSALLIQYAAPGMREEATQAVKDGILTPKPEGSAEENARISRLKKILGKNFDTYDAYRSNVLADGQGYRTLKSYRKIMGMLGEWTREMENAYHLIEGIRAQYGEDTNLPTEVIDQISELALVFQPIKPYMFTIEKFPMNDNGGTLNIPVQHKYAEAVLIPELLPAGSMLRHMALWMDQNNVDLAGAWSKGGDKIVKVGGYGSASLDGISDRESLNSALNTATVHRLNYEDYRKQTNVPEHINCSRLFGTQLRKLIMAGVDMNKIYDYLGVPKVNLMGSMTELTGRNLINFYNSLIVANILDSYEELAKEVSDPSKLADILQQAIINNSRQSLDNLLAFALEDGKFAMPLFEGGMEHDTSAMLLSIFKDRVNKQKIQGGAAVQVSAMGIKGYEEAGDLAYVGTDANGNIVRSNDVSANPIVNLLYAEIEVPFDFTVNVWDEEKGTYVTKDLKYSDYCNEDGTFIMSGNTTLIEKRFPGILDRVLYRIPTERDYSMIRGKIVRCSPKMAGGTIKVPAQGTTQAGFDFDIDKLYYHMREYYCKPNKFADVLGEALASQLKTQEIGEALLSVIDDPAEYDVTKSVLEQDADPRVARAVRNNMLLTLIEKRLEDPDTFLQRTQPGGFADHSFAARQMRELLYADPESIGDGHNVDFSKLENRAINEKDPEPNYDPSDPFTIITYNQMNQVAGKLIGIFANQNTNHAFASLMKTFKLKKPLSFCGHSYNDLLHAPEGTDPALNIAECLSASVDAVKDPVLNYLNFNTITADAGGLLARLGYTGFEIGLLFNQQCVKEACELAFNEGLPIDIAIRKIESNYTDIAQKTVDQSSDNTTVLSKQSLANMLLESRRNTESGHMPSVSFAERQLAVLSFFREVLDAAGEVSNFVTTTKFTASNSVGSTFGDMYAQQLKVKKYIESFGGPKQKVEMEVTAGINTPIGLNMDKGSKEEYMRNLIVGERNMGNPFAYEQAMYDMNVRFVQSMAKYFPYETTNYRDARELAATLTRGQTLDAGTINDIHSEMLSYILSRQDGYFNGDNMHLDKNHPEEVMTHREYYLNVFPRKIAELLEQEPELKEQYAIFQYMLLETTEDEFGNDVLELKLQDVGGLSSTQKDAIRDSWSDLAEDVLGVNTEENISPLARDLFLYCYYKAGFEFSPKSFMHLAPTAVKERIIVNKEGVTYKQLLDRILEGGNATTPILVDQERFIKTFIANHTDNYRFTYKVRRGDAATDLDSTIIRSAGSGQLAESFTLSRSSLGEDVQLFINGTWAKTGHCTEWMPAILVGNALYMANNKGTPRFNVSEERDDSMTYTLAGTIVDGRFYKRVDRTTPAAKKEEMFQPGNADHTESVPEKTEAPKPSKIDIRALAAELVKRMIKRGEVMPEEQDKMVTYYADGLGAAADEDLHQSILDAEANYGKLVDAEGNIIC